MIDARRPRRFSSWRSAPGSAQPVGRRRWPAARSRVPRQHCRPGRGRRRDGEHAPQGGAGGPGRGGRPARPGRGRAEGGAARRDRPAGRPGARVRRRRPGPARRTRGGGRAAGSSRGGAGTGLRRGRPRELGVAASLVLGRNSPIVGLGMALLGVASSRPLPFTPRPTCTHSECDGRYVGEPTSGFRVTPVRMVSTSAFTRICSARWRGALMVRRRGVYSVPGSAEEDVMCVTLSVSGGGIDLDTARRRITNYAARLWSIAAAGIG